MKKRFAEYEFSIGLRLTHWLRALCITILVITGYYIAFVFTAPEVSPEPVLFMQAKFRFVHLIFGFAMIGAAIFKTYLFFFDKKSRKELLSIKDFLARASGSLRSNTISFWASTRIFAAFITLCSSSPIWAFI